MKVSVVVALHNTGPHLRTLLRSLDGQTMPTCDFEVVLVDDGSTDDTLAVARASAAERPNLVVETIPNSGWPGRPRNVGLDLARGDYVFFSDHDDIFGSRALAAMHETALRNHADVVYGKVVRQGRETPYWPLWREDVDVASPAGLPIISRTVHKLYRRRFLAEHGIRFREGRVRLEDHEFMARVLARDPVISVVASEPCYFWIHRSDRTNTSDAPIDPQEYWRFYDHVLATWEEVVGPGELLDAARTVSAVQAYSRFSASAYLRRGPRARTALFDAVSPVFVRHVPASLDHRLPVLKRLRAQALRDVDQARFDSVQEWRSEVGFQLRTDAVDLVEGQLGVAVTASCARGATGAEIPIEWGAPHPALVADPRITGSAADRQLLDEDLGTVEITIRHRDSGVEWPVRHQHSARGPGLTVCTEASIDLDRDAFGADLHSGIWDLYARVQFLGEGVIRRVLVPADGLSMAITSASAVYATPRGCMSFHRDAAATSASRGRRRSP